ncbi:MAG: hypothetical protein H6577_26145 [Lewinellaceae bacterium]|nr:hypothetical protein [Saprospiraceae bacterium]MCB9341621.1 hypothetical protein [Lewinellaceae bacterium]
MKIFVIAFFILSSLPAVSGQVEKTIHQTFDIGESTTISLALAGEYSIVPWAGNTVMTETQVELYDASPSILKHLLEKDQRYRIDADTTGGTIKLISFDQKREPVRTRSGTCTELVHIKVFVPDNFKGQGETTFVKTR